MVRAMKGSRSMFSGFLLFLVGMILIVCTFPIFSHTKQEVELVPRSEIIIDSTFNINQSENKTVPFQLSIGQKIGISAMGNKNISCSIVNFTKTDGVVQPDQPDVIYFFQNDTTTINETWSPQTRLPEPGKYYLVFLALDAPPDSPVQVYANATKTWTDVQLKEVPAEDRIPLLDQNFVYVGSAMVVLGTALFSITFSRSRRPRSRMTTGR